MDDGLGYALVIPLFILLIPISIPVVILYIITKNKKSSIIWSIVGLPCAFQLAFFVPVSQGQGIMWAIMKTNLIAQSEFAPFIMAVLFGILTAIAGLILMKIGKRSWIVLRNVLKH